MAGAFAEYGRKYQNLLKYNYTLNAKSFRKGMKTKTHHADSISRDKLRQLQEQS